MDDTILEARCPAPPAAVYGALTDPAAHLEWAGRRQRRGFRLTSLEAPGPLTEGTEFSSVGTMPMTRARWSDRSVVVRAEPGALFAFDTSSTVEWPRGLRTEARWRHEYRLEPDGGGTRVVYTLRPRSLTGAPLRMRLPVVRQLTFRVMVPFFCRRGLRNLVRAAA